MIFVGIVVLALVALAPLAWALARQGAARGRRESALRIQAAQLAELDRDFAQGRIGASEHATAKLEVQRRVLATADIAEPEAKRGSVLPVVAALVLVPALAVGLYFKSHGRPELPAMPLAQRVIAQAKDTKEAEALITRLRDKLATLDQKSEVARQGYLLLGNAENSLDHLALAAEAWHTALSIRFDPGLAALTAEAQTRLEGRVSDESLALFRRALAEAPADAPWRQAVADRLAEAAKQ
jgi:cytochrome c-type biogenesis protein CcmH